MNGVRIVFVFGVVSALAVGGSACGEAGDSTADASGCVSLVEQLGKKTLECWSQNSSACGNAGTEGTDTTDGLNPVIEVSPGNAASRWSYSFGDFGGAPSAADLQEACDCAADGQAWYVKYDDQGELSTICLDDPKNELEWCFLYHASLQSLSSSEIDDVNGMCSCEAEKGKFWISDENECVDSKEEYCFKTSQGYGEYGECLCTARPWSRAGEWVHPDVDSDTGLCVEYNACVMGRPGMERLLKEGKCTADGNFEFLEDGPSDTGSFTD